MENKVYLNKAKNKYKGNLHTHSNRSDGRHDPKDVVGLYKEKGYDFICLSDHEIYYKDTALDTEDFICLDGYEMRVENKVDNVSFHIHGLWDHTLERKNPFQHDEYHGIPDYEGDLTAVQDLIDGMKDRGNLIIFNHPNWSRNTYETLEKLKGFHIMEIYNHQSEIEEAVGYSVDYWDYCLRKGKKLFGVATDDAHHINPEAKIGEAFGGYIVCDCEQLTQERIIDSIREGAFYASQGPEIYDLRVEEGVLKVETSAVQYIKFVVFEALGSNHFSENGSLITFAEYKIHGQEAYIRVEAIDEKGHTAWSNPIFIKECNHEE
ncbi:MAG: CehA/McbA family metallohydrolase [Anaerocolumna sp.]